MEGRKQIRCGPGTKGQYGGELPDISLGLLYPRHGARQADNLEMLTGMDKNSPKWSYFSLAK